MNTTKIVEIVSPSQFKKIINNFRSKIYVSPHALDHLSDAQRKIFKEEGLVDILLKETTALVGLQKNGRYAVFYRRKWGYLRIIFALKQKRLEIITFINTDTIPKLKGKK